MNDTTALTPEAALALSGEAWQQLGGTRLGGTGPDGEEIGINVLGDGGVGKDVAARHCPVGGLVTCHTPHEGTRAWRVTAHLPHDHPNFVVPNLSQLSGPPVPGEEGNPLSLDAGPSAGAGLSPGMVTGAYGDVGRYVTLESGHVIFITSRSGMVPPRLQAEAGASKRFSRAGLQRAIIEHHRQMNGGEDDYTQAMDDELTEAAGSESDAFRFHKKLPTEIKDAIADHPALRRVFEVTDDVRAAHGADAFGALGDRYLDIAQARAGSPLNAALHTARTSQDPEMRLLAHVHDHLPEDAASLKGKATRLRASVPKNLDRAGKLEEAAKTATAAESARMRRQAVRLRRDAADAPARAAEHEFAAATATKREAVATAGLRVGDRFKVNGQDFRVAQHTDTDGNSYRVLHGADLEPVPVEAMAHLPIDRRSFKPGRLPRQGASKWPDDGIPFSADGRGRWMPPALSMAEGPAWALKRERTR